MKRWNVCAAFRKPKDIWELKEPKRGSNGCFLDVIRVDRDLLVRPDQVNFGENIASR